LRCGGAACHDIGGLGPVEGDSTAMRWGLNRGLALKLVALKPEDNGEAARGVVR